MSKKPSLTKFSYFCSFCNEQRSREDHSCWTGDRFGEYNQLLIGPGMDTQRYNPEVPYNSMTQASQLNELGDKLIKIRMSIGAAVGFCSLINYPSINYIFNLI